MITNINLLRIYFLFFLSISSAIGQAPLKRFSFTQNKMASPLTIILYADDSLRAKVVSDRCYTIVDSLVNIFSDYDPNSELHRLCATAESGSPFRCSSALFEILLLSKEAHEKSAGTFDITVGPLSRLWREARKQQKFPDSSEVKRRLTNVGFDKIKIDPSKKTVSLLQKEMQLDLGGIAQGYIAQRLADFVKTQGIENALIDVSGDIVCIGRPPNTGGWTVAVNVPGNAQENLSRPISISNRAVTTSGDVFQNLEYGGKRFSHIVDPKTGYGITTRRNVTVIATDGATADWLTKACSLLPVSKAKSLAKEMNAAVLIIEWKKSKLNVQASNNFKHFWKKP